MEHEDNMSSKSSFMQKIRRYLTEDPESGVNPRYKRKLLDSRIEKYMDENFASFIDEYGLLSKVDIDANEERYDDLTHRLDRIQQFQTDSRKSLKSMEKRIEDLS